MCMIDDDGYAPEFWREEARRARKQHKCQECNRLVAKGEHYWFHASKHDGKFHSSKMCAHCRVAAQWLLRNCRGYLYTQVIEDLQEHAEANLAMLRLVVGANRKWRSFANPAVLMPIPTDPPDMI